MPWPLAGVQLSDKNAYGVQLGFVALPGRPCVIVTVAFVFVPSVVFRHIRPVISQVQSPVLFKTAEPVSSTTDSPALFVAFITGKVTSYPYVVQSADPNVHPSHCVHVTTGGDGFRHG